MRLSQLFSKTRREEPKDEVAKNAKLLIRGGFIHKEMAGVYAYLPLGLRVLSNIEDIIREEMNVLGAHEVLLTALQNPDSWEKTDRWKQDVWFKTELRDGVEIGLGWTQEEQIVGALSEHVASYKDLPIALYQIQTKFRNEERAKSGILRGREFRMKDLYSFHEDEKDLDAFYVRTEEAYRKIFNRVGLGAQTFFTFASGGAFSKYSHEFQTLSDTGEDTVYVSKEKRIAVNKEVYTDEVLEDLKLEEADLKEERAIEVGNIFKLGTRFSESLGLHFKDKDGKEHPVVMGCYGIGSSRVMGAIVETLSDEKGIVWPKEVSPFDIHLISLTPEKKMVKEKADALYETLTKNGFDVLYDDRDLSAGVKFNDVELIGIPKSVIVSENLVRKGTFEIKDRATGEAEETPSHELLKRF